MSRLGTSEFGDPLVSEFGDPPASEFGDAPSGSSSGFAGQSLTPGSDEEAIAGWLAKPQKQRSLRSPAVESTMQEALVAQKSGQAVNLPGFQQREVLEQPRFQGRNPGSDPRPLVQEAGVGVIRGARNVAQAIVTTGAGLTRGYESAKSVSDLLPQGPLPSRDDVAGKVAGYLGEFIPAATAGPLGFGPQSYENVLLRTEGRQDLAIGAGLVSTALGLLPISKLSERIPGVQALIEKHGMGRVRSAITKGTIEALAGGTANLGAAAATEAAARLGGATPEDINPVEQFAAGAIGQAVLSGPRLLRNPNEVRAFQKAARLAEQAHLVKDWELAVIGDRPQILHDVLVARGEGKHVQIKPRVGTDGKPVIGTDGFQDLSYVIRDDSVNQREKALLGHAEPFIDAYRKHLDSGGQRLSEFDGEAPWLALESSRRAGFLRPASELSERPATQAKIAKAQRKAADELLVLKGKNSFGITARVKAVARADAELAERMELLQGRDNDSPKGARRRVSSSIENLPEAQQADTLNKINRALDVVSERFPEETQLGTFDRLLEEFDPQADKPTYEFITALRDKVQAGAEGFKPWGERVREAQTGLREVLDTLVGPELVAGREKIAAIAKELPDNYRADLQQRALEAKTPEEMRKVVDSIAQSQDAFLRETQTKGLVKDVSRLGKNPQKDAVLKRLAEVKAPRAARTPDDAPKRAGTQGGTAGPGTAGNAGNAGETAKETKVAGQPPVQLLGEALVTRYLQTGNIAEPSHKSPQAKLQFWGAVLTAARLRATELVGFNVEGGDLNQTLQSAKKASQLSDDPAGIYSGMSEREMAEAGRLEELLTKAKEQVQQAGKEVQVSNVPPNAAVRYRGKVTEGTSHHDAMIKVLAETVGEPRAKVLLAEKDYQLGTPGRKLADELLALPEDDLGFVQNGKYLTPKQQTEALGLKKGATSDEVRAAKSKPEEPDTLGGLLDGVEKPKPLIITDPKTGYKTVDLKELEIQARGLPADQLKLLVDDIRELTRRGQIETGLYKKALKYDLKEDVESSTHELSRHTDQTEMGKRQEVARHVAKLVVDPVMMEAHLDQIMEGDKNSTTYKVLHGDMVPAYDRHLDNQAKRDKWVDRTIKTILGKDVDGPWGKHRLLTYFNQKLPSGATRGRAMSMYALQGDKGRGADLKKYGAKDLESGQTYDVDASIAQLSAADKQLVDTLKTHFQTPEMQEAFRTYTLLTGRPVQTTEGWFMSRRDPQSESLSGKGSDFAGFKESLQREIDPLKDRVENATGAFQVGDFFSDFVHVSDKLSMFGTMGKELFRADSLVHSPKFKEMYIKKFGKPKYKTLQMYLANIHGMVGHESTAFDQAVNRLTSGFTVSRVGLNVFSAAKQYMHLFTLLADGTIRGRDVMSSLVTGKALSKSERREMLDQSGLAYQRYEGTHYLRNMLVMANEQKLPSKLSVLQHYSMVLQRTADRQMMTLAWAAAKKTARSEGLSGAALQARTKELFGVAAGRDQPTDNPLYASELEIQARRSPLLRGSMSFQREQNRIYNVVRRHVTHALQNPTGENLGRAGRALLFGVAGNALGVLAVNELRRAAFAKPSDDEDKMSDVVSNLTGMYYLAGTAEQVVQGMINTKRRFNQEGGGAVAVIGDFAKAALAGKDALTAEGEITSGVRRGKDKATKRAIDAADLAISGVSGSLGLPLWSIWQQGRGLYRWTDDQTRLMTYLERERAELKDAGKETSFRWVEIEAAKDRISELHQLRQQGVLSRESAQKRIESELRRVLR